MFRLLSALVVLLAACNQPDLHSEPSALIAPAPPPAGTLTILPISPAAAITTAFGPSWDGDVWSITKSGDALRYPVPVIVGDTLTEWAVFARRSTVGAVLSAQLQVFDAVDLRHYDVGPMVTNGDPVTGYFPLETAIPPVFVHEDFSVSVLVIGEGTPGDIVGTANVYVMRQWQ
jgi:hypothetical protein